MVYFVVPVGLICKRCVEINKICTLDPGRRGNSIWRHCIEPSHICTLDKEIHIYEESKVAEIKNYFRGQNGGQKYLGFNQLQCPICTDWRFKRSEFARKYGSQKVTQAAIYETNFWPQIPVRWQG